MAVFLSCPGAGNAARLGEPITWFFSGKLQLRSKNQIETMDHVSQCFSEKGIAVAIVIQCFYSNF